LRVDMDFKIVFNSMSQVSLWIGHFWKRTMSIDLLKGCVLSPLLFPLFIIALSRYLTDITSKKKISLGNPGIAPLY
jgi:hypothetical protein